MLYHHKQKQAKHNLLRKTESMVNFIIYSLDLDYTDNCKHCGCLIFRKYWYFHTDTYSQAWSRFIHFGCLYYWNKLQVPKANVFVAARSYNNFEISKYERITLPVWMFQCFFICLRFWHAHLVISLIVFKYQLQALDPVRK